MVIIIICSIIFLHIIFYLAISMFLVRRLLYLAFFF